MAIPQQESIYMYLASVDCLDLFENNNPASFRSKLPQPLLFDNPSEWEIGLKTYIGPTIHANMDDGSSFFLIHHQNNFINIPVIEEIKIPNKYYHSINQLIETINQACSEHERTIRLSVDSDDKVSVLVGENNCGILFKTYLARILGFEDAFFVFSNFTVIKNEQCFTQISMMEQSEDNISDYEESDPDVANEILARRDARGNIYAAEEEAEDEEQELRDNNDYFDKLLRAGSSSKHPNSFLTNHNVINCLKLLANAPSKPFNNIFANELSVLGVDVNQSPNFTLKYDNYDEQPAMGVGKFMFKRNQNMNHPLLKGISFNSQDCSVFFNFYPNAGGIEIKGNYKSQLSTRLPLFWVYIDCIIDQITGNGASPVLRTIPINNIVHNENSKISVINFDDPIYVELNKRLIDVIHCDICMENGKPVKFPQGARTLLVLHLRKRQRFLYTL